jgi:uncharacterized protein (TIRG00374 family)
VGAGLLFLLTAVIGPRELLNTFRRATPVWLALVVGLSFAWLSLGALNVWILLRRLATVSFGTFYGVYITSWGISLLLPGQLGDATQVILLRQFAVPAVSSSASYLVDKAATLTWLVLVAAYGISRYASTFEIWCLVSLTGFLALGAIVGVAILRRVAVESQGRVSHLKGIVDRLLDQLLIYRHNLGAVTLNICLTIVRWIVMALLYLAAFHAFGSPINFEAAATIPVMSSLVGHIPVTVGGAGTMEWTAVLLFKQVGVDNSSVFSVYLLLRSVLIVTALLILSFRKSSETEITGASPD